jgi:hypothetical protein
VSFWVTVIFSCFDAMRDEPDFGEVLVVAALDVRADWPRVGRSLKFFLKEFIRNSGDKFWELPDSGPAEAKSLLSAGGSSELEIQRAPWGLAERDAFIAEWLERGYPEPAGRWSAYDLHHDLPREFRGTNDFSNIVPLLRFEHWSKVNSWWKAFNKGIA